MDTQCFVSAAPKEVQGRLLQDCYTPPKRLDVRTVGPRNIQDEDMLNVAAWEDKACWKPLFKFCFIVEAVQRSRNKSGASCQVTKQWCKFDNDSWQHSEFFQRRADAHVLDDDQLHATAPEVEPTSSVGFVHHCARPHSVARNFPREPKTP